MLALPIIYTVTMIMANWLSSNQFFECPRVTEERTWCERSLCANAHVHITQS